MAEKFDLIIRNALLRTNEKVDIAIAAGKIAAISPKVEGSAAKEVDAAGNLVTESFVNTHLHLCKVYTLMMMDEAALKDYHGADMGKAMTAIEAAMKVKENYDEKWIIKNV
ncbi:cytosine deaminase, partial [bacterium]